MPITPDIKWKDYTIGVVRSSSIKRFVNDLLNFPGEAYDLKLTKHKKTTDKLLHYEWRLVKSADRTVIENRSGQGEIMVPRFNLTAIKKQAILLGRIAETGQYTVQLKVGSGPEASPYVDVVELKTGSYRL